MRNASPLSSLSEATSSPPCTRQPARFLMRCFSLLVLILAILPVQAQEDETDKTVAGKRASEWMKVLRESNEVLMRRRALLALELAGPQTRKVFEEVGSVLRLDKEEI